MTLLKKQAERSDWYIDAMHQLIGVVQELSRARDIETVAAIVRDAARSLTGADGATFVLKDDGNCYYMDENAISPLWKGKRFPLSSCVSGWVMNHAEAAVIPDIYNDSRVPIDAYRPTFVKSMAMVPIRKSAPIGAIGNYWATVHRPSPEEVTILQALADTTSVAIENANLYEDLQQKLRTLQEQESKILAQHDALEVFARALAHDLKEPVRTMHSFAQLISQNETLSPKAQVYFQHISKAADRMHMLIDNVYHYTQADNTDDVPREECGMNQIIEGVVENLTRLSDEKQARISNEPLPSVFANKAQMMQLLQNLISNAIRHSSGTVDVQVSAQDIGGYWQFSVRDNGPGIPPTQAEKIFLPFKRLSNLDECSGLGLAISRKIVESHGGLIWCESIPGEGATFFFTLPKKDAVMQDSSAPIAKENPKAASAAVANMMVVDDRESDLELTRVALIECGGLKCNMIVAHDAQEALATLREMHNKGDAIDVMLLDINMPGVDGFEMLEYMRSTDSMKETPVVMCSGSIQEKDLARARSLGAVGYLTKPPFFDKMKPVLESIPGLTLQQEDSNFTLLRA